MSVSRVEPQHAARRCHPRLSFAVPRCVLVVIAGLVVAPGTATAADSIYWTTFSGKIRVGHLNGSGTPANVFPTTESVPDGVAVNPSTGKIYWANDTAGKIRVGNLNGSGTPKNLFSTAEDAEAGLAIDPAAGKIYWASHSKIRVGNLAGTGTPKDLFPKSEMGPFFLALLRAPLGVAPPAVAG